MLSERKKLIIPEPQTVDLHRGLEEEAGSHPVSSSAFSGLHNQAISERAAIHQAQVSKGPDTIGLDLGPASIAIVAREAEARLAPLCTELYPDAKAIRRMPRQMDRQRRAANPEHYDEKGRAKKRGKKGLHWKTSRNYERTRRSLATKERQLAAHRKSLDGRLVHEIVGVGNTIILEKISYRGWQKLYGKSVGLRAPGMLVEHLRRTGAAHGRHPD